MKVIRLQVARNGTGARAVRHGGWIIMKLTLPLGIGVFALVGSTFMASAADLGARPIGKAPIVAAPPPFSWTGCYIGGNAGGKKGSLDGDAFISPFAPLLPLGAT